MNLQPWFAILILTAATFALVDKRLTPAIRAYAFQSLLLGLLVLVHGWESQTRSILLFGILIFLVKGLLTPLYINWVSRKIRTGRELEPLLNIPLSLLAAGLCVFGAILVSQSIPLPHAAERILFVSGLSTLLLGFLLMATRRKVITQALGLLTMENGAFLLGLVLTSGLPFAVELAILLDVLILVVLLGILFHRIRETFKHLDTSAMKTLGE